jgi:hypothetical protein
MNYSYRDTENESIIVETRLASLEDKVATVTMWRRFGIIAFMLITVAVFVLYYLQGSRVTGLCHDEVKTQPTKDNVAVVCSHPKHQAGLSPYSHREDMIVVECRCK